MPTLLMFKRVAIKDLPEGYYKEQMTKIAKSTDCEVNAVCVKGGADDWAAYIGWVTTFSELKEEYQTYDGQWHVENNSSVPDVMDHGDKLTAEEAIVLFPIMSIKRYRR